MALRSNFSTGNVVDPTRGLQDALSGFTKQMSDRQAAADALVRQGVLDTRYTAEQAATLAQRGIVNARADAEAKRQQSDWQFKQDKLAALQSAAAVPKNVGSGQEGQDVYNRISDKINYKYDGNKFDGTTTSIEDEQFNTLVANMGNSPAELQEVQAANTWAASEKEDLAASNLNNTPELVAAREQARLSERGPMDAEYNRIKAASTNGLQYGTTDSGYESRLTKSLMASGKYTATEASTEAAAMAAQYAPKPLTATEAALYKSGQKGIADTLKNSLDVAAKTSEQLRAGSSKANDKTYGSNSMKNKTILLDDTRVKYPKWTISTTGSGGESGTDLKDWVSERLDEGVPASIMDYALSKFSKGSDGKMFDTRIVDIDATNVWLKKQYAAGEFDKALSREQSTGGYTVAKYDGKYAAAVNTANAQATAANLALEEKFKKSDPNATGLQGFLAKYGEKGNNLAPRGNVGTTNDVAPKYSDGSTITVDSLRKDAESGKWREQAADKYTVTPEDTKYLASKVPAKAGSYEAKLAITESVNDTALSYTTQGKSSNAYGRYQIMPKYGEEYSKRLGLKGSWKTPANQDAIYAELTAEKARSLTNSGIPLTEINMYGAHQQGAIGMVAIIDSINDGTPITDANISRNIRNNLGKAGSSTSDADLATAWMSKFGPKFSDTKMYNAAGTPGNEVAAFSSTAINTLNQGNKSGQNLMGLLGFRNNFKPSSLPSERGVPSTDSQAIENRLLGPIIPGASTVGSKVSSKLADKLFDRVRTAGSNSGVFVKGSANTLSKSSGNMKADFIKKASDEVAVILTKGTKSPQDLLRLEQISTRFPAMREAIREYLK